MEKNQIKFGKTDDGYQSFEINNDSGLIKGCFYEPKKKVETNGKMVLPKPRLNVIMLMCNDINVIKSWFNLLSNHFKTKIISITNYCLSGDPFFIMPNVHPKEYFDNPIVETVEREGEIAYNIVGKLKTNNKSC